MTTRSWVLVGAIVFTVVAGGVGYFYWQQSRKVSADIDTSTGNDVTGTSDLTAVYSTKLDLKAGWNFVSFPYNTVATVTDLEARAAGTVTISAIYRYSGAQWVNVKDEGTLKPGTGYLLEVDKAASLDLGDSKEKSYQVVEVPLVANTWQLVGMPLLGEFNFRTDTASQTTFTPSNQISIRYTDGTKKSLLEAIAAEDVATPLLLSNNNPNYSYTKLYDWEGKTLPSHGAIWLIPLKDTVSGIVFDREGIAVDASISRTQLEGTTTTDTSSPSTP